MDWWRIVCCAAAGYLLGSCNGAIVVSHTWHGTTTSAKKAAETPA